MMEDELRDSGGTTQGRWWFNLTGPDGTMSSNGFIHHGQDAGDQARSPSGWPANQAADGEAA